MGDVPVLKPREAAAILAKLGFIHVRQRGSAASADTRMGG
jgi:predicted RNA binding protein YcfA (HicA-like mRNA interferase family)